MSSFELSKIIFESPYKYESVSRGDKKKNFFILQRMFAINFPLQAQALNSLKIDPVSVLNFWQKYLSNLYHRTPFWMYTKGAKKTKEAKEKKLDIKESTIKEYAKRFNLDIKSVRDAIEFFPKESAKEFKDFEKIYK